MNACAGLRVGVYEGQNSSSLFLAGILVFCTIYKDLFEGAIYDLLNNDHSILIEFYSGRCLFINVVDFLKYINL